MASTHGKSTVIQVSGADISAWTNNSQLSRSADTHDKTGYGSDDYEMTGGLRGGTFTAGGWYDTTSSSGTGAVLPQYLGKTVTITRRVQGTGSNLPEQTFSAVLNSYVESSPHNDIVRWTSDWTVSGAVTTTNQT